MGSVESEELKRDRDEESRLIADEQSSRFRRWDAEQEIQDPAALKQLLNDESLAYNLAGIMSELDNAIRDVNVIQRDHSVPDSAIYGIRAVLRNAAGLQRILFSMAMGDE